jgi:Kef-type K+ transport system membrane component KefB
MAHEQGRSTTGWGRWAIGLTGAVILAVSLAAQLALAILLSLCGLAENEVRAGSWCGESAGVQQALVIAPMVASVAAYGWTLYKARLTPVLFGGPALTVIWAFAMLSRYAH